MEFFTNYSLFLLKSITFVVSSLVLIIGIVSIGRRSIKTPLNIESLNEHHAEQTKQLQHNLNLSKADKKKIKEHKKNQDKIKKTRENHPRRFVLNFNGDIGATQVNQLRDEISVLLTSAGPKDEVVVRLESPGGAVSGYGLAASQLQRIRDKNIPLTVCIDKVAASGGYLMACVANTIIAAPFAIIGSIGVVAQLPNFHRFLKKHNIDIELLTAGEYKRTLTVLGENTNKDRKKFQEDLEAIQASFRDHVLTHRADINIDEVATGEHWLAKDAIQLGLIDQLKTSDDYLYDSIDSYETLVLTTPVKPSLSSKLFKPLTAYFSYFFR
ncbi:MAG: protease SohB [Legionellaceae bacterium]|nr:protease SohB [Legionellaceae bacterium]